MSDLQKLRARTRSDYGFFLDYRTRWNDNDMYGHVNNSVYSFLVDSIVNAYLIKYAGSGSPPERPQRGLVAHTQNNYFGPVSYPTVVELGLRVNHLGKSSVRYEIGVFDQGVEAVKAVCELTHVFVGRESGRPSADGMDGSIREALGRIAVGKISGKL